ncbi:phage major capsid protein [Anaerotignum sp.]|uniref:phage major capsid protein n=1 Tax=Anaerotignum sp. TaxID=2039241 RepID=UPI0028A099E7|nr:phage major capsid protein [Anaerotignum sp.]
MKSNDIKSKEEVRVAMQSALSSGDTEAFSKAMNDMMLCLGEEIKQDYESQIEQMKKDGDTSVLALRGVRQLTSNEKQYYQKVGEAMKANDPKQALVNLDVVMPETVINSVFEDLQTEHPLLSKITFMQTGGAIKMLLSANGKQEALWGALTDAITKELLSGFVEVNAGLLKLSAFIPVSKSMLDLGPEWLDKYIRQILAEALANGLENGIVKGDGKEKPIGMIRQVGEEVTVTGGVYPEKAKITVKDLSATTVGNLLSLVAVDPDGKPRTIRDILLIVNPQDYFQRVMPATTIMAPDGTYRNDVMPYPMAIVQSAALSRGEAVMGLGYRYFAAAGMEAGGKIEYSDQYKFLEDNRVYLTKLYANGFPMDNAAFLHLDISDLHPLKYKMEQVTPPVPSTDANLSDLRIGSLTLSPVFAAGTTTYTAATTNGTNTITATPKDAGAQIEVKVGANVIDNGSAPTWATGDNTVTIKVTAADGETTKTYTVTVTKS